MNFLNETLEKLQENGKTENDVLFVMCNGYFSFEKFKEISDFIYSDGYGSPEIPTNIMIVGYNWWLERGEYDGSEWWEFKTLPKRPNYENLNPIVEFQEIWE